MTFPQRLSAKPQPNQEIPLPFGSLSSTKRCGPSAKVSVVFRCCEPTRVETGQSTALLNHSKACGFHQMISKFYSQSKRFNILPAKYPSPLFLLRGWKYSKMCICPTIQQMKFLILTVHPIQSHKRLNCLNPDFSNTNRI